LHQWAAVVVAAAVMGCGSSVIVTGEQSDSSDGGAPPDGPPDVEPPPPPPPPPPPIACGGSERHVDVQLVGDPAKGCSYGSASGSLIGFAPLQAADGIAITLELCAGNETCPCTIEVAGVGADLVNAYPQQPSLFGPVSAHVQPHRVELYEASFCATCTECPCPAPLPLLYAAEGTPPLAEPSAAHPLIIEIADQVCQDNSQGCSSVAQRLQASAHYFALGGGYQDLGPTEVSDPIEEGGMGQVGTAMLRLEVLRASGRSASCAGASPDLTMGSAAWVVRPVFGAL
jgi:hypothetical protein